MQFIYVVQKLVSCIITCTCTTTRYVPLSFRLSRDSTKSKNLNILLMAILEDGVGLMMNTTTKLLLIIFPYQIYMLYFIFHLSDKYIVQNLYLVLYNFFLSIYSYSLNILTIFNNFICIIKHSSNKGKMKIFFISFFQ